MLRTSMNIYLILKSKIVLFDFNIISTNQAGFSSTQKIYFGLQPLRLNISQILNPVNYFGLQTVGLNLRKSKASMYRAFLKRN